MPHLQVLPNNLHQSVLVLTPLGSSQILYSHLCLGLPIGIFPVGLTAKILKALLSSSILSTYLAELNLLDLISLTMLFERYKILISSTPHSNPSWAQIIASGSCCEIHVGQIIITTSTIQNLSFTSTESFGS